MQCALGGAPPSPLITRPPPLLQLTHKEGPLSGQDIIRGAYVNTASKDVGIDPNYGKARLLCGVRSGACSRVLQALSIHTGSNI